MRGDLDLDTSAQLDRELTKLCERGATWVTLDASDITFVDSSGLRTIVRAGNALQARGGRLLIEGMSPAMQRLLEVSGLLESYRPQTE
jgi:anti-anti-sigma factor